MHAMPVTCHALRPRLCIWDTVARDAVDPDAVLELFLVDQTHESISCLDYAT